MPEVTKRSLVSIQMSSHNQADNTHGDRKATAFWTSNHKVAGSTIVATGEKAIIGTHLLAQWKSHMADVRFSIYIYIYIYLCIYTCFEIRLSQQILYTTKNMVFKQEVGASMGFDPTLSWGNLCLYFLLV